MRRVFAILERQGAATRMHVTNHLFLRPAVRVNRLNNFFLFGSNRVPRRVRRRQWMA